MVIRFTVQISIPSGGAAWKNCFAVTEIQISWTRRKNGLIWSCTYHKTVVQMNVVYLYFGKIYSTLRLGPVVPCSMSPPLPPPLPSVRPTRLCSARSSLTPTCLHWHATYTCYCYSNCLFGRCLHEGKEGASLEVESDKFYAVIFVLYHFWISPICSAQATRGQTVLHSEHSIWCLIHSTRIQGVFMWQEVL